MLLFLVTYYLSLILWIQSECNPVCRHSIHPRFAIFLSISLSQNHQMKYNYLIAYRCKTYLLLGNLDIIRFSKSKKYFFQTFCLYFCSKLWVNWYQYIHSVELFMLHWCMTEGSMYGYMYNVHCTLYILCKTHFQLSLSSALIARFELRTFNEFVCVRVCHMYFITC